MPMSSARRPRRWIAIVVLAPLVVAALVWGGIVYRDLERTVAAKFEGRALGLPARIYSDAFALYPGLELAGTGVFERLRRLGYREAEAVRGRGDFHRAPDGDGVGDPSARLPLSAASRNRSRDSARARARRRRPHHRSRDRRGGGRRARSSPRRSPGSTTRSGRSGTSSPWIRSRPAGAGRARGRGQSLLRARRDRPPSASRARSLTTSPLVASSKAAARSRSSS